MWTMVDLSHFLAKFFARVVQLFVQHIVQHFALRFAAPYPPFPKGTGVGSTPLFFSLPLRLNHNN